MRYAIALCALYVLGCRPGAPAPTTTSPDETDLIQAHNRARAAQGAPPVRLAPLLQAAAQKHASWMAQHGRLSHTGASGSSFVDRLRAEGYVLLAGGENIAQGQRSVAAVMASWLNSPGHRQNILDGRYTEIGVGRSGDFWCVVLARPARGQNVTLPDVSLPGGVTP